MSSEVAVQQPAGDIQQQLADLDRQIAAALRPLKPRMRKFLYEYVKTGNATLSSQAAGYSKRSASNNAHRLTGNDGINKAYELLSLKDQLQHGLKPETKRAILANIAQEHAKEQPRAAVAAVNELNRMDGGHKPVTVHSTNDTTITIAYDLTLPGRGNIVDALPATGSGQGSKTVAIAHDADADDDEVTDEG